MCRRPALFAGEEALPDDAWLPNRQNGVCPPLQSPATYLEQSSRQNGLGAKAASQVILEGLPLGR